MRKAQVVADLRSTVPIGDMRNATSSACLSSTSRGRRRVARRRGRCGTSRAMPSTAAPLFRPWRPGLRRRRCTRPRRSRGRPRTRCRARPRRRCPTGRASTRRGPGTRRPSHQAAGGCGVCPRSDLSRGVMAGCGQARAAPGRLPPAHADSMPLGRAVAPFPWASGDSGYRCLRRQRLGTARPLVFLSSQYVPCELPRLRECPAEQEAHHQELADGDGGELVGRVYDLGDARGEHDGEEP